MLGGFRGYLEAKKKRMDQLTASLIETNGEDSAASVFSWISLSRQSRQYFQGAVAVEHLG